MAKIRDFVNLTLQFRGFFLFIQPSQATASTSNICIKPTSTHRAQPRDQRNSLHISNKKREHFYPSKMKNLASLAPLKNTKTKKLIKIKKTLDFSTA